MDVTVSRAEKRAATAERILRAARAEFGDRGMDGATIRGIAARAGIDPSLVLQHYGSKAALFALAVEPVADLGDGDVKSHLSDVLDVRLRELDPATRALLRSMLTSPDAAQALRAHLENRADALADGRGDEGRVRAAILVSSILGVTIARHFLDLPALRDVDGDEAARILGALLERPA
ncbi:TetR/AcrR family transcriptional regulator [Microbacterium sp. B19]|uniref:TetR/AcrR family transcriptional regulator n=1 Tax=Microbacterium sp. B19 TaxID=96765 RepID=UPI0003460FC2|nr:TetR/AcrR family transcriptional regulator [Microbacterium sp. B19]